MQLFGELEKASTFEHSQRQKYHVLGDTDTEKEIPILDN